LSQVIKSILFVLGALALIEWVPYVPILVIKTLLYSTILLVLIIEVKRRHKVRVAYVLLISISLLFMIFSTLVTNILSYNLLDLVFLSIMAISVSSSNFKPILSGFLFSVMLSCVFQFLFFFDIINPPLPYELSGEIGEWARNSSLFKSRIGLNNKYNTLSYLYALALVFVFHYFKSKRIRFIWVTIILSGQLLTLGRGGMIVTTVFLLFKLWKSSKPITTAIFLSIAIALSKNWEHLTWLHRPASNDSRVKQFTAAIDSFGNSTWFGTGFGYNLFDSGAIHIHNFMLNSLIAGGWIGLVWSCGFLITVLFLINNAPISKDMKLVLICITVLQAMVENFNPLNTAHAFFLYWLLVSGSIQKSAISLTKRI